MRRPTNAKDDLLIAVVVYVLCAWVTIGLAGEKSNQRALPSGDEGDLLAFLLAAELLGVVVWYTLRRIAERRHRRAKNRNQ